MRFSLNVDSEFELLQHLDVYARLYNYSLLELLKKKRVTNKPTTCFYTDEHQRSHTGFISASSG